MVKPVASVQYKIREIEKAKNTIINNIHCYPKGPLLSKTIYVENSSSWWTWCLLAGLFCQKSTRVALTTDMPRCSVQNVVYKTAVMILLLLL